MDEASLSFDLAPIPTIFFPFPSPFRPLRLALLQRLLEIGQESGFLLFVLLQLYERQGLLFQGGVDLGVGRERKREGGRGRGEEEEKVRYREKKCRGKERRRHGTNKHVRPGLEKGCQQGVDTGRQTDRRTDRDPSYDKG